MDKISINIQRYNPLQDAVAWNQFVGISANGTFLHQRDYMDYHSDRFKDCSLMAYLKGKLVAVLPACIDGNTLSSHSGLTYGGWIVNSRKVNANIMLEIFAQMKLMLKDMGVKELVYKPVPSVYHRYPCDEDIYALFRGGAEKVVVNISSVVPLNTPLKYNENANRNVKFAIKNGIVSMESRDFASFWNILVPLLAERHNATPVHTLTEMQMLAERFPENIRLFASMREGKMIAGTVVYVAGITAHAQYIAASDEGREFKVLPMLFADVMKLMQKEGITYFDFGTSNEQAGQILNASLLAQKAGMGGRGIAYETYRMSI